MDDVDDGYSVQCPYCGSATSVDLDPTAGRLQVFTVDCETCCHPIAITARMDEDGAFDLETERELS